MPPTYVAVLTFVWTLAAVSTTNAQTLDPEGELYIPELRDAPRLMIGAGGGIGFFDGTCPECRALGSVVLDLSVGLQVHPRVAVLIDGWSTTHLLAANGDNPGITGFTGFTAAVQTWITPIVFIRSGIGFGGLFAWSQDVTGVDHGPAFSILVGGELGHRRSSGIDLAVRTSWGASQYSDLSAPWTFSFGIVIGYHRNLEIGGGRLDP